MSRNLNHSSKKHGTPSKKRAKLNGKTDIRNKKGRFIVIDDPYNNSIPEEERTKKANKYISEAYGARIEKPVEATASISAAAIRSRGKNKSEEAAKPMRKYDMGNTVYIPAGIVPFTNALIVGVEWGGDHRNIRRDVWAYYVRDVAKHSGSQSFLVTEDQVSDRISM